MNTFSDTSHFIEKITAKHHCLSSGFIKVISLMIKSATLTVAKTAVLGNLA